MDVCCVVGGCSCRSLSACIPLSRHMRLAHAWRDVAWSQWKGTKLTKGNSYRQQTTPTVYGFGHERLLGSFSAALQLSKYCVAVDIQVQILQADNISSAEDCTEPGGE